MFSQNKLVVSLFILVITILTPSTGFAITVDQEIRQARILLEELKNVTPGTKAADQVAMKIMHNYQCKKLLKSGAYKDTLGVTFHDLIYGDKGIANRIIKKAQAKMLSNKFYEGKYKTLAAKLESIRNTNSIDAPMDLDFGILENIDEGYTLDKILKEIKSEGGNIEEIHKALNEALEDSFRDVGKELDLPPGAIDPEKAFIAGTTGFHGEGYRDVGAIKGQTPLKKWAAQSADVSRYKINHLKELVKEGKISAASAAQEAARGTLKDMKKVEATFAGIAERTGKTPKLSKMNQELRELLQELADATDPKHIHRTMVKIKSLKGSRSIFDTCNNLIDNMEAAWKLTGQSDPKLLFQKLLKDVLPEKEFKQAMEALEEGALDKLPKSVKNLREELFNLAARKRISLSNIQVDEMIDGLKNIKRPLVLKGVKGDTKIILAELINDIDIGKNPKVFKDILGDNLGDSITKLKSVMSNNVKASLITRMAKRVPLKELDVKLLELGDSRGALGVDAFIGTAMALYEINNIIARGDLTPEQETRELHKAIVTNIPIVGDFLLSINNGVEWYYEGDNSKGAQSAVYLVIGIGGLVPGAQIPALIAGLGMASTQMGGMAWDAYWDRKLVDSWIKSGDWDEDKGILDGIYNNQKKTVPHDIDFDSLVGVFTEKYKHDYEGMPIRDSIFYYADNHLLKGNKTIQILKLALHNTYPDFDVDEAVKQPGKRGEGLLRKDIKEAGGRKHIERNIALTIYTKYKEEYDSCVKQAINFLKSQAEAEYQALHQVGEAKAKREALKKLGKELKVPLVRRVEETFTSFAKFLKEAALSTLSIDTMGLKRQKIFEDYLKQYIKIKDTITTISDMIKKLGLNPPAQWNLTGYINIDKERIDEIYNAYFNGLAKAKKDAIKIHNEKIGKNPAFNLEHPCDNEMRKKLASIQIRLAHTKDLQMLYWKRSTVARQTDLKAAISEDMPLDVLVDVVQKIDFGVNELEIYLEATGNLGDRVKRLEKEYAAAIKDYEKELKQCFEKDGVKEDEEEDEEDVDEDDAAEAAAQAEEIQKLNEEEDRLQREREEKEIARIKKEMEEAEKERLELEQKEKERIAKEEANRPKEEEIFYKFSATINSAWDGGVDDYGKFWANRHKAEFTNPHEQCTKASAWSYAWAKLSTKWEKANLKEYTKAFHYDLDEHKRWGRKAEVISFSIGSFSGEMVDTKIRYRNGGWSMGGYKSSSTESSGHGYAVKGKQVIEFGYNTGSAGCFNNTDRAFQEAQAAAAQGEAKSILSSINLAKETKINIVPHKGIKLKDFKQAKVSLNPNSLKPLKSGETAMITAEVEDAEPEDSPFTYNWTGEFSGKGKSITIQGKKPGKYNISVTIEGARYPLGSASLEYEVGDYKVSIERVGNQGPVAVGGSIGLKANLVSGGNAVTGDYVYRWQPHPEVKFKDIDSNSNQTIATFTRLGTEKIWVQVLKKEGDVLSTIAESEQIVIEVGKPKLTLSADPQTPLVGEVVNLKVVDQPVMDEDTASFWWEVKGNTMSAGAHASEREYKFIPEDTKPVNVIVHAKGIDNGDDLGEQTLVVTAKPYQITVSKPKALGPAPRIWKEGKGLVEVENAIAVFQNVSVKATVSPKPKNTPLRYKWTVAPEGCTLLSPTSQETTANASQTGTYSLTVTIEDSKGVELGSGKGSLSVTVSQQQINAGKEKDDDTSKKIAASKEKLKKGKLDEAIADAEEALAADPDNEEAKNLIEEAKIKKVKAEKGLQEVTELINSSDFLKAHYKFVKLMNKYPYHPPVQKMEKQLQDARIAHINKVKAAIGDIKVKTERRDYKEALEAVEYARNNLKLSASELKTLSQNEAYLKPLIEKKQKAKELFKSSSQKFNADDYQGCIDDYLEGFKLTPNMWNIYSDNTIHKAEEIYREAVAKQKELEDYLKVAKGATTIPPYHQRIADFERGLDACSKAKALQPHNELVPEIEAELNDLLAQAREEGLQVKGGSSEGSGYYQMNFAENYNHPRPVKPFKVDGMPVTGYNDKDAYMVCLGKCQTQFNDGVCYPENYEWTIPSVIASEVWFTTNLFWWGNHASGEPIAKVTVSGDKGTFSFNMIGNGHTGEWNQNYIKPAEGVTIHNGARSFTTHESRVHVARFPFNTMKVNSVKIELLTVAKWGTKSAVFAIYGATLVAGENASNAATEEASSIAGEYFINANGYKGSLTLRGSGNSMEGEINLRKPEKLINISFDGKTLIFTRQISGITQVYTGVVSEVSGKLHFEGTFTSSGGVYHWFADKE